MLVILKRNPIQVKRSHMCALLKIKMKYKKDHIYFVQSAGLTRRVIFRDCIDIHSLCTAKQNTAKCVP